MFSWMDIYSQNAAMIKAQDEAATDTSGKKTTSSQAPGGETAGTGRTESAFQAQREDERKDYGELMGNGLSGSGKFTKAEIRRGYRKL